MLIRLAGSIIISIMKFHIEPPLLVGVEFCSNGLGHITNMAAMTLYGKNLNKSSLTNGLASWYEASGTGVLSRSKIIQIRTLG